MKFIVSEDTEIVLDGEKYLLEKGDTIVLEKWKGSPEIEQTGENTKQSVSELKGQVSRLKKAQENRKKQGKKADPEKTEKIKEKQFAIRAKRGKWRGKGAATK